MDAALAFLVLVAVVTGCSPPAQTPAPDTSGSASPMTTARTESSSSAAGSSPSALVDGAGDGPGSGEWRADPDDGSPWAQLTWSTPQRLATVQVHGPVEGAFDPQQSTAAALHGDLTFSDGSTVVVSGVAAGGALPTTVAFTPREVTWVRFELRRTVESAVVGLRELRAYGDHEVAPVDRGGSTPLTAQTKEAACDGSEPAPEDAPSGVSLVCPPVGATVSGVFSLIVAAPAGARLSVWASLPEEDGGASGLRPVAVARASASRTATIKLDARELPGGPIALKVLRDDGPQSGDDVLYAQVVNQDGRTSSQVSEAPTGMGLRYAEEFDEPLTATATGEDALYATLKPEPWGGSQFGDGLLANPEWGAGTIGAADGYLRLRVEPIGDLADRATWDQEHLGGLLSSQRFGGSGFSAQHGYFEARVLGAPGPGAWSAFWAMNTESGTGRAEDASGELDVVELYGHDTASSCHSVHSWSEDKEGDLECLDVVRPPDWAATWHTYGALVQPDGATFYVDGREVAHLDELSHTDEPFFFMLDLTLGGGWPVDLDRTSDVTDLYVDWVRVYT